MVDLRGFEPLTLAAATLYHLSYRPWRGMSELNRHFLIQNETGYLYPNPLYKRVLPGHRRKEVGNLASCPYVFFLFAALAGLEPA